VAEDAGYRAELAAAGVPRLLPVASAERIPTLDADEDWACAPTAAELRGRLERLAQRRAPAPTLDEFGILRVGSRWVALSPTEERIIERLLGCFGRVVAREDLRAAAWDAEADPTGHLNTQVHRLRRRVEALGLSLHTVRASGLVLDFADSRQVQTPRWLRPGQATI
jgi:DNA-binding response OmpR family regulator